MTDDDNPFGDPYGESLNDELIGGQTISEPVMIRLEFPGPNHATYWEIAAALRLMARGLLDGDDGILELGQGFMASITPNLANPEQQLPANFKMQFTVESLPFEGETDEPSRT